MSVNPEAKEGVADHELRDDPEYQLRALQKEAGNRMQEALEQGVEPAEKDIDECDRV